MKLTLKQIAEYCSGTLFGDGELEIDGFFTDSRKAEPGKMFVPVRGENVDAHRFIPTLPEKGCRATFSQITLDGVDISYVLVDDTIAALQKTAEKFRETLNIPVIGITGSVGKTTTKEMISLVLESGLKLHKTEGNANSQIGLPRTILGIEPDDQAAVVEMGMSLPGEMERIAKVAKPNLAVITNIGVSHIEFHGSKENIMAQKLHIADYLGEHGKLFVNGDDPLLSKLKDTFPHVITFGVSENCDHRAVNISSSDSSTSFLYQRGAESFQVQLPALGFHNIRNALVALALAQELQLPTETAIEALKGYTAPEMRQQIKNYYRVTIIDDSYNASPDSMIGALDILCQRPGRKIAVLADMLELGSYSEQGHREVGEYARQKGVDILVGIGPLSQYTVDGFGDPDRARHFNTNEEALTFLHEELNANDAILVKGSRGMKTDAIVKSLDERLSKNPILSSDDVVYLRKIVGYYRAIVQAKQILADAIAPAKEAEDAPSLTVLSGDEENK